VKLKIHVKLDRALRSKREFGVESACVKTLKLRICELQVFTYMGEELVRRKICTIQGKHQQDRAARSSESVHYPAPILPVSRPKRGVNAEAFTYLGGEEGRVKVPACR
jgi:hypothetical protein